MTQVEMSFSFPARASHVIALEDGRLEVRVGKIGSEQAARTGNLFLAMNFSTSR
jgi:hypothetical protein